MRALLLTMLVLGIAFAAAPVADAQPQPLVGGCNEFTNPCWNGAVACVWISQQVPQCVKSG
jgi:hypothetical protein